jgi:hypothetical protein
LDIASNACTLARHAKKTTENTAREAGVRYIGLQDDEVIALLAGASPGLSFDCNMFRGTASCGKEVRVLDIHVRVQTRSRIVQMWESVECDLVPKVINE